MRQRAGRWVFVDLVGKGKRIRTVPIPPFVKVTTDAWTAAAGLSEGPLFRRVRRRKYPEKTPQALSERMIWHIVMKYARKTGLATSLAPTISGGPAPSSAAPISGVAAEFERSGQRSAGAGLCSIGGQALYECLS